MRVKDKVLEVLEHNRGTYISGATLANELGVSRNAIWKAIKSLQQQEYCIDAVPNLGYCLKEDSDVVSVQSIRKYIAPAYGQIPLEVHQQIDSTNTRAKEYAGKGDGEKIIVALEQTAGRGRMGRSFYSPSSSGVYISFLLRPEFDAKQSLYLTTAAAVAAAQAIEQTTGIEAKIKWVNDVFCHGKKVCGILTEASLSVENNMLDYAVTGIGFNLFEPEGGFPEEIKDIAGPILTANQQEQVLELRSRLIANMINFFLDYYECLTEKTFMIEYKKRSFLIGQQVYTLGNHSISGKAIDIDDEGHLVVQTEQGDLHYLSSGEVSVRMME